MRLIPPPAGRAATLLLGATLLSGMALAPAAARNAELHVEQAPATDSGVNVESFWDAYGTGSAPRARQALEDLKAANPEWTPGRELTAALERLEQRHTLMQAAEAGDHATVLEQYRGAPALQRQGCKDLQLLWEVAEARGRTGQREASRADYQRILSDCGNTRKRVATLHFAADTLGRETATRLARQRLEQDIDEEERRALKQAIREIRGSGLPKQFAGAEDPLATDKEERFAAEIREQRSRELANLMGFYLLRTDRADGAERWFRRSNQWGPNATATEGLARVALERGKPGRAERISRDWRHRFERTRAVHDEAVNALLGAEERHPLDPGQTQRIERMAREDGRADWLTRLGWYHLEQGAAPAAARTFGAAVEQEPTPERIEGLASAYQRLGERQRIRTLEERYGDRDPAYAEVLRPFLEIPSTAASEAGTYLEEGRPRRCIDRIRRAKGEGDSSVDLWLVGGWCYKAAGEPDRAAYHFEEAHARADDPETREEATLGQAMVMDARGDSRAALRMVRNRGMNEDPGPELRSWLHETEMRTAFEAGDYHRVVYLSEEGPETRAIRSLRAWALYKIGKRHEAHALFRELDDEESTRESREGLRVTRNAIGR